MFTFIREVLGRGLGLAKGTGNEIAQWVFKVNGEIKPRKHFVLFR